MKRSLALILALVMLFGMLPLNAFATETTEATEATEVTEVTEATETTETTAATEATEATEVTEATEITEVTEETEETETTGETEATEVTEENEETVVHEHEYESAVTDPSCTEQGYTTYTCDCGDSYVDDYVDAKGHSYGNGVCSTCGDMLAGKAVSILGDSISTYSGVSNNTNYNSTIGSNKVYYSAGTQGVYQEDTWWQQTLDVLGMELCANNSWSGSAIFGTRAGTVGAYSDRCVQLHNDNTGEEPDIILVFLGTNDFSYTYDGGELGNYDLGLDDEIDFPTLIQENEDGTFTYEDPTTSTEAYAIMLHKMQQRYPDAEIYCMSLMTRRYPVYSKADVGQPTEFNAKLKEVIDTLGVNYIELEGLFASDPADFDLYMGDKRVHPNKAGMDLMTEAVVSALMGEQTEICTVSYSLNGVVSNNTTVNVLIGGRYNAILSAADTNSNISVTVTMDGEDVTASCYKNGEISISNVSGDIEIIASIIKEPANYRWELIDGTLASTGDEENAPTLLAGSVSDGVQNSTQYSLAENVVLKHDQPWLVEWKSSGDWSGMLLTSTTKSATSGMEFIFRTYNTTGLLALGYYTGSQYNNYGVPLAELELDMNQSHTYRMENRIADDSSNMVYLLIDGVEIGALNNYYIGGTKDQNATVDWVSGQDFTFGYIGSTSHPLKNMELQYLQIWEGGAEQLGPIITQQPADTEAALGEDLCITVEAEGEGLKYQWYIRNAGSDTFSKSSITDNTYDVTMTKARAGREVYCVITDANGNSVTSDTVKLIRVASEELEIITQPVSAEAALGEAISVFVEAKGEGLKYQWYIRNAGSTSFSKSSTKTNTYTVEMTKSRANRELYCVITDALGNTVTSDTVKLIRVASEELEIITQPVSAEAALGEELVISVEVKGEGLKYQWYLRNAGSDTFSKSSITDNTYDVTMTKARAGREVYCVITDALGNQITTDTVRLIRVPSEELAIIAQPISAEAAMGEELTVFVEAKGEGLKYQWYIRNAGSETFSKSSTKTNTYTVEMTKARAGRELYCVITDALGNQIVTETVKLILVTD